jgi:peptide/nickel transport system permease protein
MLLFSVKLGWLPTSGASGFKSIIMPAICAGLSNAAVLARMTRSSMVDELHADYLRTARAKGAKEKNVVMKHAYRNASIPIVTTLGQALVLLLGGTVVVETVFSWPGIGYLIVQSVRGNEYTLVTGFVILTTILVALVLLVVDILYAYIDPRIKARYTGK